MSQFLILSVCLQSFALAGTELFLADSSSHPVEAGLSHRDINGDKGALMVTRNNPGPFLEMPVSIREGKQWLSLQVPPY